jgi:putative hydrolase of the HAD superfamily
MEFERGWALERRTQTVRALDGSMSINQLRIDRMRAVCRQLNVFCKPADIEYWVETYFRIVDQEISVFPDVYEVLEQLSAYRCIIATNGAFVIQSRKLDRTGLYPAFERFVCSVEEGVAKPNLEFFRRIVYAMDVSAQECLMVGDSYNHDVLPPRIIGMHSVLIDRVSTSIHADKDFAIQSLHELPRLIESL